MVKHRNRWGSEWMIKTYGVELLPSGEFCLSWKQLWMNMVKKYTAQDFIGIGKLDASSEKVILLLVKWMILSV